MPSGKTDVLINSKKNASMLSKVTPVNSLPMKSSVACVPVTAVAATAAAAAAATTSDPVSLKTLLQRSEVAFPPDMTFELSAEEIVFHSFIPSKTYEATLTFKNRTKANQFLRVARPESHCFTLAAPKGAESTLKVASGLTVSYRLFFTPEENVDYSCSLAVTTDHEEFYIPVRAFGSRGSLELPARFTVNDAPVKGSSKTSLFLRNVGSTPCVWRAIFIDAGAAAAAAGEPAVATSSVFALSPSCGTVSPDGGVEPVEVVFAPGTEAGTTAAATAEYSGIIRFFLGAEGDMVQDMPIFGTAIELPVFLDVATVEFADTFVTTERQAVVTVRNDSNETIQFCWKADYNELVEDSFKETQVAQTRASLTQTNFSDDGAHALAATADISRTSAVGLRMADERIEAIRSVQRVFDDEVFSIEPTNGVIYGRGTRQFTVTFCPQLAVHSSATAFLDIAGRRQRLPLQVAGSSIGPQCKLEYTRLNIGDVYMNALHEYEVEIENVGSIEARFAVLPTDSIFGQKFTFLPSSGVLAPGEMQLLKVQLQSDIIGVISDTFHIHLHGGIQDLTLQFKGRVVGPTFQFDVDELDFGNVSYNFWHARTFHITNTSHVPMGFTLHLPRDCVHEQEFQIIPAVGVIAPHEVQEVRVELLSNTVGDYETALIVDIDDVGENVDSIPVRAACMVPPLFMPVDKLTYGRCFVGYDYTLSLEVVNETSMSGKFEVVMLGADAVREQADVRIGAVDRESTIEILESHSKVQVPITLRALDVGSLTFLVGLRTLGNAEPLQTVLITATACGPLVDVQPTAMNFGTVPVLESVEKVITLSNTSPIPAEYKVRFHKTSADTAYPIFCFAPSDGVIEPYSSAAITVSACLDEAMAFTDDLIVDVKFSIGAVKPIPIRATGKGFALVPEVNIVDYNFGDVFTDTSICKEIVIHNKGRKDQEVQWQNMRGSKAKEGSPPLVFFFRPERTFIPARGSATFRIEGLGKTVGVFTDEFSMKQSGTFKDIMRSKVTGNFIAPVIAYSTKNLQFEYIHDDPCVRLEDAAIIKSFTMKNVTSMNLEVQLRIRDSRSSPFSLEGPSRFTLATGATSVVGIKFDPAYRGDFISHNIKDRVAVSFVNHTNTESVGVSARLLFPSIRIEPEGEINFGTIFKDTEQRRDLVLHNESTEIAASFSWRLVGDALAIGSEDGAVKRFDFIPFQGTIPPGGSQTVEAAFYGSNGLYNATAMCEVAGGPNYPLKLVGAAGEVSVHYDRTTLDFGVMQYYAEQTRSIVIANPSHVAVSFSVNTSLLKNSSCVRVTPTSGTLRDRLVLNVTFTPTVPDEVYETFTVQVGHFDPQLIVVTGQGQMNTLTVFATDDVAAVVRDESDSYAAMMEEYNSNRSMQNEKPYISRTSDLPLPRCFSDPVSLEVERLAFCNSVLNEKKLQMAAGSETAADKPTPSKQVKVMVKKPSPPPTARSAGSPAPPPSARSISTAPPSAAVAASGAAAPLQLDLGAIAVVGSDTPRSYQLSGRAPVNVDAETAFSAVLPERRVLRRNSTTAGGSSKYVLARYVVDFGHMTRTDTKTTRVRIVNTCPESLFLVLDSKELVRLPVTVNPVKVPKLDPLEDVTLEVTLDATTATEFAVKSGENRFEFCIDIKGGPVVVIQCRCFVATPSLRISDNSLCFDEVVLGQVKVVPLVLTNEQAVPCDWRLTLKDATKHRNKAANFFGLVTNTLPSSRPETPAITDENGLTGPQFWTNRDTGSLAPGESTTVDVFFAPYTKGECSTTFLLRFLHNAKVHEVKCQGIGCTLNVMISPSLVQFPVVRPFQVVHEVVKVTNYEDTPVEVFSYNLDPVHAQECRMLEMALKLTAERRLILPTRGAGQLLPDELLERIYSDVHFRESALIFTPAVGDPLFAPIAPIAGDVPPTNNSRVASKRVSKRSSDKADSVAAAAPSIQSPVDGDAGNSGGALLTDALAGRDFDRANVQPRKPCAILVIGPPQSGKTTQTHHLQELLGYTIIDLDALIAAEAELDTANGEVLRNLLAAVATREEKSPAPAHTGPRLLLPKEETPLDNLMLNTIFSSSGPLSPSSSSGNCPAQHPFAASGPVSNVPPTSTVSHTVGKKSRKNPTFVGVSATPSSAHGAGTSGMADSEAAYARFIPTILKKLLLAHIQGIIAQFVQHHQRGDRIGFVFDDLKSTIISDKLALYNIVKEVCTALSLPLKVVSLAVSEAVVGQRYVMGELKTYQKVVNDAYIEPLSEADYEAHDPASRDDYNRRLKYYNDCRRVLNGMTRDMARYESVLAFGPQPSVQERLHRERQAALGLELAQQSRGARKTIRTRTIVVETATILPRWGGLSPLDAFKQLHTALMRAEESVAVGAAGGNGQQQAPLPSQGGGTVVSKMAVVNAEDTAQNVTEAILSAIAVSDKDVGHHGVSIHSPILSLSPGNSLSNTPEMLLSSRVLNETSFTSGVPQGGSCFIDLQRLRHMRHNTVNCVRFFSMVEREVTVVAKKNTKVRMPTCTRHYEEMSRWVIPAQSSAFITVEFCSDRDGAFDVNCQFGVVGTLQTIDLAVHAHIALPDMGRDEKTIFPLTRPRLLAGKPLAKVFLTSKRLYDFGPLLVPAPTPKRRRSERVQSPSGSAAAVAAALVLSNTALGDTQLTYGATETLTFVNEGVTASDVTLTFMNEKDRTFTVSPSKFTIDVGASQSVVLRAFPEVVGEINNKLIACVKDNPAPWIVEVHCVGSRPALTLDGRKELELDFGRSALGRVNEMTVMMANASQMPVLWRLNGIDKMPPEVILEATNGVIEENGAMPLTIRFEPTHTCLYTISLQVLVTDPSQPNGAYEALPLTIKVEGHDVVLEWTREVDFKLMHVGESKREQLRVLNKSPYDVGYMIRMPRRLQNLISVSPQVRTLRGMLGFKDAAIAAIDVTARLEREGEIPRKLGQLEVAFFHPEHNELLYPLQTIPVLGEAWYTRFALKPTHIDFGSCFYSQRKEATFELRNTGRFPVTFSLFDYKDGHESHPTAITTLSSLSGLDEALGASTTSKKVKNTNKDSELRIGCFTILPIRGTVPVGETIMITVATVPESNSRTRETLGILVDQSGPEHESKGVPFELSAHPATPGICADLNSNSDVETIFEEQQVVFRLDQFDSNAKAYGKEDRTFSFGTALVGHRVEERFRIANSSPLECTVTVQLQSAMSTGNGTGVKGGGGGVGGGGKVEGFDLGAEADSQTQSIQLVLPPFESRFVTVCFTPSSLQRFDARFVANVENGTDSRTNTLIFGLAGEGTLPNVEYILPPRIFGGSEMRSRSASVPTGSEKALKKFNKENKKISSLSSTIIGHAAAALAVHSEFDSVVQLPLTHVGGHTSKCFTIRNVGLVPVDMRVIIASDEAIANGLIVTKRNRDITIPVGSEEVFEVVFEPVDEGTATMKLLVSLLDNPFENKEIIVEARSFIQSVSFEDIDPACSDFFKIGDCYINEPKQYTFQMRNNTNSTLRFSWTPPSGSATVQLVPAVGHIAPGATKPITATVTCTEPAVQKQLSCEVYVQSIEVQEYAEWDSSMMNQRWVMLEDENSNAISYNDSGRRNLRKVMEPVPEPVYRLTEDVTVAQQLHVGYTCDRPTFKMHLLDVDGKLNTVDVITYPVTKIFQKRIVTLRVINTGGVGLLYNFNVWPIDDKASPATITTAAAASGLLSPLARSVDGGEDATNLGLSTVREFTVKPSEGVVPPGQSQDIAVTFAPRTAEESSAKLIATFPFSVSALRHQSSSVVEIPLHGMGECPLVHFNIPASDYLANRMDGEAGTVLDPETLVLEMLTRGLHTRTAMRFKVVNPTATSYQYEWLERARGENLSPFRCLTPSGTIMAGKQLEMAFEFSADTLGIREAPWTFNIPGKASVPFLLVGKAVDPDVFFNSSKLSFGCVNVGNRVEKTIILENRDDVPFNFAFDKTEISGASSFLTVKPLSGTIGAKEKLPITIYFAPQDEMEYNVPLACQVKKASAQLTINVKGEGICVHDSLQVEPIDDTTPPLVASRAHLLHLNLGRVQVDERVVRRFILSNKGQHAFDFAIAAQERRFVSIDEISGTVMPKQRSVITFTYYPTAEETLRQYRLLFKIAGKVAYQVGVQATTYIPRLHLSFERYDFGPRFITSYNPHGEVTATLTIINNDKDVISVDCNLPQSNDWCTLDTTSFVARPDTSTDVKLTFLPRETRMHDDKLTLVLNGVHPIQVPISGEGIIPRVEVLNHYAKLGVARIGECREIEMRIECRSRIATPVSFVGCVDADLVNKGISISSAHTMLLKPREVRTVTIMFKPTVRMGEFQREMKMLVCGREFPFALITGSCEDAEMHLDTSSLRFDDVVAGSSATRRVVLMNSGDISQKFSWNGAARAGGELTVTPPSGFIRSHTEFVCEVHYTPTNAKSQFVRNLSVDFDNSPPLNITVEANAIERPAAKGILQFRCRARETVEQKLTVDNKFGEAWTFEPTIDNPLFTGPKEITIKAKNKAEVTVVYAPLRSTRTSEVDEGTLFIPQPDGTALTFRLDGFAEAPGPSGAPVNIELQVNDPKTVKFAVRNWTNMPLRFVKDILWTPTPEDGVITMNGPSGIEVPASCTKEYSLIVSTIREGFYLGTISFRCPERSDMLQFYEISMKISGQPNAAVVELQAPVRNPAVHNISLTNPLAKAVTATCKLEGSVDCLIAPGALVVPPKSTANLPIEFFPLVHKEYAPVKVQVTCAELGTTNLVLNLTSSPCQTEKMTRLVCPLGQSIVFPLRFTHYARTNTEFTIRFVDPNTSGNSGAASGPSTAGGSISGGSLGKNSSVITKVGQGASLKAQASPWPKGQELVAEFCYEPQAMGGSKETIELVSPVGGTYTFPILATCTAPQRQGPYMMKPNQNTPIPFKNIFSESISITVVTDSPAFSVTKKTESVAPKKSISIPVQCKMEDNVDSMRGKLIVSCVPPGGNGETIEWVYYLECSRYDNVVHAPRRSTIKKKGSELY